MARRRTVLGIPVGKKKPRVSGRALLAAGAGLAALPGAVATARKVGGLVSDGTHAASQASDLAHKAERVTDAIGQHGSTLGKIGAAVSEIGKLSGGGDHPPKLSHVIEEHTDVAVPRQVAYNQWTQFETFPSIVKGAEQVEQVERDKTAWRSKIGPSRRQWTAEITEQVPDERIAWKSAGGLQLKGVVTFHSLGEELTRVLLEIEYTPRGPVEHVGNLLRIQRRRVRRDLRLFKHFLELRGDATGAWRSRIAKKDDAEDRAGTDDAGGSTGHGRVPTRRKAVGEKGSGRQSRPRQQNRSSASARNRSAARQNGSGQSRGRGTTAKAGKAS